MKRVGLLLSLLVFAVAGYASADAVGENPDTIVQRTSEKVLSIINHEGDSLRQNPSKVHNLLDDVLLPVLDFRSFAKLTLGTHWRGATDKQRERFVKEFQGMLIRTYTRYLVDYAGTQVTVLPRRGEQDGKRWTVDTEIALPGKKPLPVQYSFRFNDGQWKAYNVTVNGLSLVQLFREEFNREIDQTSLDALNDRLAETNRQAATPP